MVILNKFSLKINRRQVFSDILWQKLFDCYPISCKISLQFPLPATVRGGPAKYCGGSSVIGVGSNVLYLYYQEFKE